MERELTITLSDDVYEGLSRKVGSANISKYIEDLLRSLVATNGDLESAYRDMAADTVREQEAMEWIEVAPDDALE